jgi:hypothetical protein
MPDVGEQHSVAGQVTADLDEMARPDAVGPATSTAMGLVSGSLADSQDERVSYRPLEFPVVIAGLVCVLGCCVADICGGAHLPCALP